MTPQQILATKEHFNIMDRVSKKKFFNENEQQECFAYIVDRFQENNFSVLEKYIKKKGNIKTFIRICCNSFAIDFLRQKNSRRRFPKAISDMGKWAKTIYDLTCWKQYSAEDAYEISVIQNEFQGTFDAFIAKIKPIIDIPCKYNKRALHKNELEKELHAIPENPLEILLEKLDTQRRSTAAKIIADIKKKLPVQDQLLIKLVYGEDISVNKAAQIIGISPSTGHKRLKKLLIKFKEGLLAKGIGQF